MTVNEQLKADGASRTEARGDVMRQVDLLICTDDYVPGSVATDFGGKPIYNVGEAFSWPICAECDTNMRFQGKVHFGGEVYLIFQCEFEAGSCSGWDADSGANKIIRFSPGEVQEIDPPAEGVTGRETQYSSRIETVTADTYSDALSDWRANGGAPRQALGSLGGEPDWYQGDQNPFCSTCGAQMTLVAHLEEGPVYDTGMNFGGGLAYLFTCLPCPGSAKFLFQC